MRGITIKREYEKSLYLVIRYQADRDVKPIWFTSKIL